MIRKKNGFLTFIFSLIPGAGEMYMGFMKQGVSLMTLFFGILFLYSTVFYTLDILAAILPVIWAYSFFHVHNLRAMPDELFYAQEDNYLFNLENIIPKEGKLLSQYRKIFSVVLIFLGIALLWQSLNSMIRWVIPDFMRQYYNSFVSRFPQIVISLFMVWSGVWLIKGKKNELYGGDNTEASETAKDTYSDKNTVTGNDINAELQNGSMNAPVTKEGEN